MYFAQVNPFQDLVPIIHRHALTILFTSFRIGAPTHDPQRMLVVLDSLFILPAHKLRRSNLDQNPRCFSHTQIGRFEPMFQ